MPQKKTGCFFKENHRRFGSGHKNGRDMGDMDHISAKISGVILLMAEILHHLGCMKPYQ